jgi:hypothetical protein
LFLFFLVRPSLLRQAAPCFNLPCNLLLLLLLRIIVLLIEEAKGNSHRLPLRNGGRINGIRLKSTLCLNFSL